MNKGRHLQAINITPEAIYQILYGWKNNLVIRLPKNDWPDDVRFLSCTWDHLTQSFFVVFEHESFPLVIEGGVITICPHSEDIEVDIPAGLIISGYDTGGLND